MSIPTKPGFIIMAPIPVLRGPLQRPRSTVQVWVCSGGRGSGRLTVLRPGTQRSPARNHSDTIPIHRDPYVDGPSVARTFAGTCDRIACDHMSGLFVAVADDRWPRWGPRREFQTVQRL